MLQSIAQFTPLSATSLMFMGMKTNKKVDGLNGLRV